MDDSQTAASAASDRRAEEAAEAARDALLDAIRAAFGNHPPHERLCVHWDGFGDNGAVDLAAWGRADPAEDADPKTLTCHLCEEPEPMPPSVEERAMDFALLAIDAHEELHHFGDGDGGVIDVILDCRSGRATVDAQRREARLQVPDTSAIRNARLPLDAPEAPNGEWAKLGLSDRGAKAIRSFARGVSSDLRAGVEAVRAGLWEELAEERIVVRYCFNGEGDEGMLEDVEALPTPRFWADDGLRQQWHAEWAGMVFRRIGKMGIDDVCTGLADRAGWDWSSNHGGALWIELRLPLDASAEEAAVEIARVVQIRTYPLVDDLTFDMSPGPPPQPQEERHAGPASGPQ